VLRGSDGGKIKRRRGKGEEFSLVAGDEEKTETKKYTREKVQTPPLRIIDVST